MTDFSQFYTNGSNANSNFKESFTIEQIKASQGGVKLDVIPCKDKPGKMFFACGLIRGSVSSKLAEKIANHENCGTLMVSHVVNDGSNPLYPNKFNGLLLHEQSENGNSVLTL